LGTCISRISTPAEEKEIELVTSDIDELNQLFTYENVVDFLIEKKKPILYDKKQLFGARIEREFIEFGYIGDKQADAGWKAHLAIDDKDKSNLSRAWNILKNIFIEEKLHVKVVQPKADFFKDPYQFGKQITIYCYNTPNADWRNIFAKIESALLHANIREFTFDKIDRPLPGSKYITYCNDSDELGNYIPAEKRTSYNTGNFEDPFINFNLEPKGSHLQHL
jgi:hypothetical protein